jgi:hypothetical protein
MSDKTKSSAFGYFNHATNGSNQKSRRLKMTKHASTSNCVGKDGGRGCGGMPLPLPLPLSLCLWPSLCTPLLPKLLPLLPWSPRHCPRTAATANNDSSKHGAPPKPPPPSLLPSTWGGSACIVARGRCPLCPIAAASLRRIGIISVLAVVAVLPPHSHLPLPPATTGSVVVDVYSHDQLDRAHGLADGALVPMFPPGMGWAGGGGEQQ